MEKTVVVPIRAKDSHACAVCENAIRSIVLSRHHASKAVRVSCKRIQSPIKDISWYIFISSAKCRCLVVIILVISFKYRLNKKRAKWDPCGTTNNTGNKHQHISSSYLNLQGNSEVTSTVYQMCHSPSAYVVRDCGQFCRRLSKKSKRMQSTWWFIEKAEII